MKRNITQVFFAGAAMLSMALGAQSTTENHVVTKTYKEKSKTILNTQDPTKVTTSIQYVDGLGRVKQSVLVKGGSGGYGNNHLRYDWSVGQPKNSGFYNLNGSSSENRIINGTTPFGDTGPIWECRNISGGSGWVSDHVSIDHTKTYRYTTWVKKTGNTPLNGKTYHGVHTNINNLNGTTNSNPYFFANTLPQNDVWYLLVGIVHPSGYTGGDTGVSGVYNMQGKKVLDGTEFKWTSGGTYTKFRNYLFNADSSTKEYLWSPVVQKIDGTEDSLNDIITNASIIDNTVMESKDIVTHFEYDNLGRQTKEFLPYASAYSDGRINTGAGLATQAYYKNNYANDFSGVTNTAEINAYSDKVLESSPLGRVFEQTAPGKDWKKGSTISGKNYSDGHTIRFEYETNTTNEVKRFDVSLSFANNTHTPSLSQNGFYSAARLFKTITKDENWKVSDSLNHTTEEFTNKQGQVILKRAYNNNKIHDTYYVYDDFGNLTYVLPPKGSAATSGITNTVLNKLCYQYKYDRRNRLVEKKIPGKGWEYIVYDKLDRPVMTQDAVQRLSNKWLFTKYDALGRVIYTGEFTDSRSRILMQRHVDVTNSTAAKLYENKLTTANSLGIYYSNSNFPSSGLTVFTVNYYDSYADLPSGLTIPTKNIYKQNITTRAKGLATVSKVRVLEQKPQKWITTISCYDEKARPIYVYSHNEFLKTTDLVESKLDFVGKVLETVTTHKKTGKPKIVTIDQFTYDHQNRLISQTQKINNQLPERIVRNNYNNLGQLKSKLTGNGTQSGHTSVTSGVTINNDIIKKTGGNDSWYEGLATLGTINGNGYVEFSPNTYGKFFVVGLAGTNPDAGFFNMEHSLYIHASNVFVFESGVNKGSPTDYQIGDRFRVERIGNKVYYKKNGTVVYISEATSVGTLMADVSLFHVGVEIKDLHLVDNSKGLQNVDYNYNVRGWLTSINNDAKSDNDLFNFTLRYNNPVGNNVTKLFNGNISQTSWTTASTNTTANPVSNLYTYSYDALNRITSAIDNTGNYNLKGVSYDKNGNILTLQRKGHTNIAATSFGVMDNLSYTYSGNRLLKVVDAAPIDKFGFKDDAVNTTPDSSDDYAYDANGNMTRDDNKGIANITYNHLNLPVKVTSKISKYLTSTIEYVYDATGVKLSKKVIDANHWAPIITTTDYAGNYIYENNTLQFFNHSEGYVKPRNYQIERNGSKTPLSFTNVYQYKDHLGNIRLSYADSNGDGIISTKTEIIVESNYYPFGLLHKGYNNVVSSNGNSVAQKRKFGGFELQDELNLQWYDITARNYDAALGRWMNLDPKAELMHDQGLYNYSFNSPILFTDPDGQLPWPITIRSFISASSVAGDTFRGDGRGASTDPSPASTSRVESNFTVDPAKGTITNVNTTSDDTVFYGIPATPTTPGIPSKVETPEPSAEAVVDVTTKNGIGVDFKHSAKDPVTPDLITPDLDVQASIDVVEDLDAGALNVTARFTGDGFPSTEAFITDQSGKGKILLGAHKEQGGLGKLFGENKRPTFSVNLLITIDKDGNFTGVQHNDKTYTVEEWNKKVQESFNKQ